jgi:hypothetical protein
VELTASYYPTQRYWFSAITACISGIIYRILTNVYEGFYHTVFIPKYTLLLDTQAGIANILGVFVLGILCGVSGAMFSYIMSRIVVTRLQFIRKYPKIPYAQ